MVPLANSISKSIQGGEKEYRDTWIYLRLVSGHMYLLSGAEVERKVDFIINTGMDLRSFLHCFAIP